MRTAKVTASEPVATKRIFSPHGAASTMRSPSSMTFWLTPK